MTADQTIELARRAFLLPNPADGQEGGRASLSKVVRIESAEAMPASIGEVVCTIGAFDGIHLGHRFLFSSAIADARQRGISSAIVTFDPDPDELFLPTERVRKLLDNEDRIEYLRTFGADYVVVISFTRKLAGHSVEGFLREVLGGVMHTKAIHVGDNFRLGAGNQGTVESLRELGELDGFVVHGHDLRRAEGTPVSATRIRDCIESGAIDEATGLLCRPYYLRGEVVKGRQQGHGFGFPTANVQIGYPYVIPAEGVYAGFVESQGRVWPAAVNVGIPRTFAGQSGCAEMEGNLIGFDGDLYGKPVRVAFTKFLRPQRTFASRDELVTTVMGNISWVADNYGREGFDLPTC